MLTVPTDEKKLISWAQQMIQDCSVSMADRAGYCRLMHTITETGRYDNTKSLPT